MKLWKRTVLLMLVTLLCALIPVGTLSLYITGKRSLNNAAETYGRQLENGKVLLEQFWDNSKYGQMSETGKRAYVGFQFQRCCGEGMALIDRKSNAVIENLTDYKVVGLENLGLKDEEIRMPTRYRNWDRNTSFSNWNHYPDRKDTKSSLSGKLQGFLQSLDRPLSGFWEFIWLCS